MLLTVGSLQGSGPASSATEYLCGKSRQNLVGGELYSRVQSSQCCVRTQGLGTCLVDGQAVDFNLYATIKAGSCQQARHCHNLILFD